jgi:ADP-ribosylglycohydrolase
MDTSVLFKKTYGCLAGAALGDAMGGLTEAYDYPAVQRKWGRITGLVDEPGIHGLHRGMGPYATTDDTQHRLTIFEAIIEKGGRIDAYDMAEGILEYMNLAHMASTQQELYKKTASGMPAHEIGLGQWVEGTPSFACLPIGIINACDPYGAAKDAYEILSVWVGSLAQEAPMAVAAAVAAAFRPAATRDSVIQAATAYCGPRVREHLEMTIEVAAQFDDPWEALPTFNEKLTVPDSGMDRYLQQRAKYGLLGDRKLEDLRTSGSPLEMAGLGLAFFYVGNGDPIKAIGGAASLGRDCDGFAGIAGAITGAWKGIDVFDMDMVNKVEAADKAHFGEDYDGILDLTQKMQAPMLSVLREKEAAVSSLQGLL